MWFVRSCLYLCVCVGVCLQTIKTFSDVKCELRTMQITHKTHLFRSHQHNTHNDWAMSTVQFFSFQTHAISLTKNHTNSNRVLPKANANGKFTYTFHSQWIDFRKNLLIFFCSLIRFVVSSSVEVRCVCVWGGGGEEKRTTTIVIHTPTLNRFE